MSEHHTCQICHIWHIWHFWHLWHLAFDIHTYVNMGVKRSVRTSGMQPIILNILHKYLLGQKLKYPFFWFFLCIFKNFLCIFEVAWGTLNNSCKCLKFLLTLFGICGITYMFYKILNCDRQNSLYPFVYTNYLDYVCFPCR